MEIKYQIFENENLLIQKYRGIFTIEDYINYSRYIAEHLASKSIKKVLIDFQEIIFSDITDAFNKNLERIVNIRKHINENELKNKNVTLVIWVDKPIPTAIALLFTANFSSLNYKFCSTAENVIEILTLPENFKNIGSITNNLENTFKEPI